MPRYNTPVGRHSDAAWRHGPSKFSTRGDASSSLPLMHHRQHRLVGGPDGPGKTTTRCLASQAPQACNPPDTSSLVVVKCCGDDNPAPHEHHCDRKKHNKTHQAHGKEEMKKNKKKKKKAKSKKEKKEAHKRGTRDKAGVPVNHHLLHQPSLSNYHYAAVSGSGEDDPAYRAWLIEYQQYIQSVQEHNAAVQETLGCCTSSSSSSSECTTTRSSSGCSSSDDYSDCSSDDESTNSSDDDGYESTRRHHHRHRRPRQGHHCKKGVDSACEQARTVGETNPVVRALECGLCDPQRIITQRNRAPPHSLICDACDRFLFWIQFDPDTENPHCCNGYPSKKVSCCPAGDDSDDDDEWSTSSWSSSQTSSDTGSHSGRSNNHGKKNDTKKKPCCCKPTMPFKNGYVCMSPDTADAKVWVLGPDHKYTRYPGTFRSLVKDTVFNTENFRTGATPCALTHKHDPCEQVWVDDRLNVLSRALTGGYYLDSSVEPQPEFPCPQDRTEYFDISRQLKFQWCHGIWYVISGGKCCAPASFAPKPVVRHPKNVKSSSPFHQNSSEAGTAAPASSNGPIGAASFHKRYGRGTTHCCN